MAGRGVDLLAKAVACHAPRPRGRASDNWPTGPGRRPGGPAARLGGVDRGPVRKNEGFLRDKGPHEGGHPVRGRPPCQEGRGRRRRGSFARRSGRSTDSRGRARTRLPGSLACSAASARRPRKPGEPGEALAAENFRSPGSASRFMPGDPRNRRRRGPAACRSQALGGRRTRADDAVSWSGAWWRARAEHARTSGEDGDYRRGRAGIRRKGPGEGCARRGLVRRRGRRGRRRRQPSMP